MKKIKRIIGITVIMALILFSGCKAIYITNHYNSTEFCADKGYIGYLPSKNNISLGDCYNEDYSTYKIYEKDVNYWHKIKYDKYLSEVIDESYKKKNK